MITVNFELSPEQLAEIKSTIKAAGWYEDKDTSDEELMKVIQKFIDEETERLILDLKDINLVSKFAPDLPEYISEEDQEYLNFREFQDYMLGGYAA